MVPAITGNVCAFSTTALELRVVRAGLKSKSKSKSKFMARQAQGAYAEIQYKWDKQLELCTGTKTRFREAISMNKNV